MIRLINNELRKIFYKKNTYFVLLIILLFVVFTNVIYKKGYVEKEEVNYSYVEDDSHLTYKEKAENNEVKKAYFINKYVEDNKLAVNNNTKILINFFDEYQILVIFFIVIISSNMISLEFTKGTIKQLLIFPHKRLTIIMAKIITAIVMLLFIVIYIFIFQFVIGNIFFSMPSSDAILYNYSSEKVLIMNTYKYLILEFINKLPVFLLTILFTILISLITASSSLAITLSFLNNIIIFPIINNTLYKVKLFKYFISPNMDLTIYLFGRKSIYNTNFIFSLYIDILYIAIIFTIIIIIFVKKDIKNI